MVDLISGSSRVSFARKCSGTAQRNTRWARQPRGWTPSARSRHAGPCPRAVSPRSRTRSLPAGGESFLLMREMEEAGAGHLPPAQGALRHLEGSRRVRQRQVRRDPQLASRARTVWRSSTACLDVSPRGGAQRVRHASRRASCASAAPSRIRFWSSFSRTCSRRARSRLWACRSHAWNVRRMATLSTSTRRRPLDGDGLGRERFVRGGQCRGVSKVSTSTSVWAPMSGVDEEDAAALKEEEETELSTTRLNHRYANALGVHSPHRHVRTGCISRQSRTSTRCSTC